MADGPTGDKAAAPLSPTPAGKAPPPGTPAPNPLAGLFSDSVRKVLFFGLMGALGCGIGAFLGEPLFALMPTPKKVPVDVVFVLDITASMQPQIDGVRSGIIDFSSELGNRNIDQRVGLIAYRDRLIGEEPQILNFGGSPFTSDTSTFRQEVGTLFANGGGDQPESTLDALVLATQHPFRPEATKVILLITDAPPVLPDKVTPSVQAAAAKLKAAGIQQVHLVINPADRAVYTPLTEGMSGEVFMLDDAASGGGFDRLIAQLGNTIANTTLKGLQSNAGVEAKDIPWVAAITCLYTALLAIGVSLFLVGGQNLYLKRERILTTKQAIGGATGGLAAGAVAGGVGQALFFVASGIAVAIGGISLIGPLMSWVLLFGGRLIGWAVLGALIGFGMSYFVPNLNRMRAVLGGAAGGVLGAIAFMIVTNVFGMVLPQFLADSFGRLMGAVILGLLIGLMLALIEAVSRALYLEVRYGAKEVVKVSLGTTPVTIGNNGQMCTIYAREATRPMAFQYKLENGQVTCVDFATEKSAVVNPGDAKVIGNITVTVRNDTSPAGSPAGTAPPPAAAPKSPPPPPNRAPPPPATPMQRPPVVPMNSPAAPAPNQRPPVVPMNAPPPPPPKAAPMNRPPVVPMNAPPPAGPRAAPPPPPAGGGGPIRPNMPPPPKPPGKP